MIHVILGLNLVENEVLYVYVVILYRVNQTDFEYHLLLVLLDQENVELIFVLYLKERK